MPLIKSPAQIEKMRESGRIVSRALRLTSVHIEPGVTPIELNAIAERHIREEGAVPNFLGYKGYKYASCISVNDRVVHGVPDRRPLQAGDLVTLDFGAEKEGWHADSAWTYAVGEVDARTRRLMNVTREALNQGIAQAKPGKTIGDIGAAVQRYCEKNGYGVVRALVGHGIGTELHDLPKNVPMYGRPNSGERLKVGMCMCIEPMINAGKDSVVTLEDEWTVVTEDGSYAAHYEHTIAITKNGPEILTKE